MTGLASGYSTDIEPTKLLDLFPNPGLRPPILPLKHFGAGLRRDGAAVVAGLTVEWSSGTVVETATTRPIVHRGKGRRICNNLRPGVSISSTASASQPTRPIISS